MLLLIPLIAMQFTTEVNWGMGDFLIMGALLLIAGSAIELVLGSVTTKSLKLFSVILIILLLLLVIAELGVGVFGSPWAGD